MMVYLSAFILGLAANFHCLGMCGPLALALPLDRSSNRSMLLGVLQYNAGRIATYALFGSVFGLIGLSLNSIGILQWFSIFSGVFLVLFAWRKWIFSRVEQKFPLFGMQRIVSLGIGKVLASQSPMKLFFFGIFNGLLPCGMVYLALIHATLSGHSGSAALSMLFFGLGTLPAMLFVAFAANRITGNLRQRLSRLIPFLLTLVGLMVILRGLNLDIPYLSPKIEMSSKKSERKELIISCCPAKKTCEVKAETGKN